jgi:hypothetical protein
MIDSKELRIGNKLLIDGKPQTVSSIRLNDENGKNKRLGVGYVTDSFAGWIDCTNDLIEPIPLTEDIILKAGLEVVALIHDRHKRWSIERYICIEELIDGVFTFRHNRLPITSLHQLQNLYWSLCGKELDIKL